jgi:predicted Zn-dependent peptidase
MTVDDLLARVNAVTVDAVRDVAADLLTRPMSLALVGPFGEQDFEHLLSD